MLADLQGGAVFPQRTRQVALRLQHIAQLAAADREVPLPARVRRVGGRQALQCVPCRRQQCLSRRQFRDVLQRIVQVEIELIRDGLNLGVGQSGPIREGHNPIKVRIRRLLLPKHNMQREHLRGVRQRRTGRKVSVTTRRPPGVAVSDQVHHQLRDPQRIRGRQRLQVVGDGGVNRPGHLWVLQGPGFYRATHLGVKEVELPRRAASDQVGPEPPAQCGQPQVVEVLSRLVRKQQPRHSRH